MEILYDQTQVQGMYPVSSLLLHSSLDRTRLTLLLAIPTPTRRINTSYVGMCENGPAHVMRKLSSINKVKGSHYSFSLSKVQTIGRVHFPMAISIRISLA